MPKLLIFLGILLVIQNVRSQGSSLYLPPDKGYDYPTPNQPGKPPSPPSKPNQPNEAHEPGMPFDFKYEVNEIDTTNQKVDFDHVSKSDGDIVQGEYKVALPDGRTQIVKYTADWKNGYNAEVIYE